MGKNFLDLCNDILGEMYWEKVTDFSELTTTEGERVKTKLNQILQEIVISQEQAWTFRERSEDLMCVEGVACYDNVDGYIVDITPYKYPAPLTYVEDFKYMPLNAKGRPVRYWIWDNQIRLFPIPQKNDDGFTFRIRYYTNNICYDDMGNEKPLMTEPTDEPIIPNQYRDILVYGVCKDLRASLNDPKSMFFEQRYRDLYKRMLSECRRTTDFPNGLRIDNPVTTQKAFMDVFYNPRANGGYRNNG